MWSVVKDCPTKLVELQRRFSTDQACREYLFALRWPQGFVCPRCGGNKAWPTARGLWLCSACCHQASVTAGTIFQDTRLPLTLWFRAIWYVTSQKNGVSALSFQRVLGLGSYQTAWAWLHKLRRAMVRPGRDPLRGVVEVDQTCLGASEEGAPGRQTEAKALIAVAAEAADHRMGRIRLRRIADGTQASLHGFIREVIEPGSVVRTDGLPAYHNPEGYVHEVIVVRQQGKSASELLPRAHRVVRLLKRWLTGTYQGAVGPDHLDYYLDEFTFRFNRRKSSSRGKLFYRLIQQAVQVAPHPYHRLIHPKGLGVVE